jgi:hypothetical protein
MIGIFHDPTELKLLADEILSLDRPETYRPAGFYKSSIKSRHGFAFQV